MREFSEATSGHDNRRCARIERGFLKIFSIDSWTRKRRPVGFIHFHRSGLSASRLVYGESSNVLVYFRLSKKPPVSHNQGTRLHEGISRMSALLDVCGNDTGSPSISKAEDNLSNSDGPLIKSLIRQNSYNSVHAKTIDSLRNISSTNEKSTKRRYCLWTLTLVLAIIGLCNLFLNITVIAVLRISRGMEAVEVIPDENLVKFYGKTDLDKISLQSGVCQSYGDEPMEVSGDEAGVRIDIKNHGIREYQDSKLTILLNGTTMSQLESFEIKDPQTGTVFFTTDFPNFGLPTGVETIDVKIAETYRIISPINESLSISSENLISMHGAEGVRMESKEIVWSADVDIFLKSINGSMILDTKDGVSIDVENIPVAPIFLQNPMSHEQYKVCVCMPQGKLFKVPVKPGISSRTVNCARIARSSENDPCLH